ncbi:hypothetical protein J1605_019591 [Eschrichtius robustus]|uniref:Uncharacterized protein n=1 Tax=Eschrichtius robustus TaxID=9764 RepID=A0AB34HP20_ESCRO|nr:hypothetical protein J1605_019591 [Eschrichtius robustus]
MLSAGAFVVCGRRPVGASAGSRPCLSRGAAQAWSPLGAHRGDALCPSSPRRPVTPSEGDRKSRRRVSVRLWLRVTFAPSPLSVSPLRIPSLFPFSDCKVGLFNLFLGPVGKDEKQTKVLQLRRYCVDLASPTSSCCLVTRDLVHQEEGVLELHSSCVGHGDVSGRSGDVGSVCKEKEVVQTAGPWRGDFLHKWRNRRMNTDGGSDGNVATCRVYWVVGEAFGTRFFITPSS